MLFLQIVYVSAPSRRPASPRRRDPTLQRSGNDDTGDGEQEPLVGLSGNELLAVLAVLDHDLRRFCWNKARPLLLFAAIFPFSSCSKPLSVFNFFFSLVEWKEKPSKMREISALSL
jgi:hypothetical protein